MSVDRHVQPEVDMSGVSRDTRIQSAGAIRADRKRWIETRDVLVTTRAVVHGLDLGAEELSQLGEETGAISAYRQLQDAVEKLLQQGADAMEEGEVRLYEVSRDMELTQEENKAAIESATQMLEKDR